MTNARTKLNGQNISKAKYLAANQAMLLMNAKYVPMSSKQKVLRLRTESYVSGSGDIVYTMPYARAQFYGVVNGHRILNYTTAGTSRRWDLRLQGNRQDMQAVTKAARKVF